MDRLLIETINTRFVSTLLDLNFFQLDENLFRGLAITKLCLLRHFNVNRKFFKDGYKTFPGNFLMRRKLELTCQSISCRARNNCKNHLIHFAIAKVFDFKFSI